MASTKTPATKTNGGSAGRLPSTRERRPALAALAVLLIVGGALASAWLAVTAGNRADFVVVSKEVGQGEKITDGDLDTVELPEDFDGGVPWADRDEVIGEYAATPWTQGMVLVDSMVTDDNPLTNELYEFPISLTSSEASHYIAGSNIVVFTGSNDGPIIGRVLADPDTSSDSSDISDELSLQVGVDTSCGAEIANADQNDSITTAGAGSPDPEGARQEC